MTVSNRLTIISQVGRSQRAQYPVLQPRKRGLKTQTVNEGFSSITLQSVLVLKGTKKRTIDTIELTIITKLGGVIELNIQVCSARNHLRTVDN